MRQGSCREPASDQPRCRRCQRVAGQGHQIAAVALAAAGLYGDLQGILGSSLAEIEQLSLPADPAALPATASV